MYFASHDADSRPRRTELLPGRCPFGARAVPRHLVGQRGLEPRANRAGHDDQRPGGAGVQRTRRPAGGSGGASAPVGRVAALAVLSGSMATLPARGFGTVAAAQIAASLGGALMGPALTALTLGIVGK